MDHYTLLKDITEDISEELEQHVTPDVSCHRDLTSMTQRTTMRKLDMYWMPVLGHGFGVAFNAYRVAASLIFFRQKFAVERSVYKCLTTEIQPGFYDKVPVSSTMGPSFGMVTEHEAAVTYLGQSSYALVFDGRLQDSGKTPIFTSTAYMVVFNDGRIVPLPTE